MTRPTLDHRGEFDELFTEASHVHIERMNNRGFWMGIDTPKGRITVNTGIADGEWFFNVHLEGSEDDNSYCVRKPASYARRKP